MKGKKINANLIIYILGISVLLMLNNLCNLSIKGILFLYICAYLVFLISCFNKFKSIKLLVCSSEFIYLSVFFIYSLPASFQFIFDNYVPRISYFLINYSIILQTLKLYFNIFLVTLFLICLFGGIKNISEYNVKEQYVKKINIGLDVFDFISLFVVIYFYYLHLKSGLNLSSTYFMTLRMSIQSDIGNLNSYIYLYMISYCFTNFYIIINDNRTKNKLQNIKVLYFVIISILFWGISLLTDRRNFVNLLLLILLCSINKIKKIKFKNVFSIILCVLILLSISYFRSNTLSRKFNDIMFLSTGEFVLTNYVSSYYINHNFDKYYGSTYVFDTFTSFIPRSLYKNKPELLSKRFKKQTGINVAYAYNPVAEGIVNFGTIGAIFVVPCVLLFLSNLAYFFGKKNLIFFYIVCGESINFCRGIFSVSMFSIVFISIFSYLILWFMRCRYLERNMQYAVN